jgi:hypothetical protein
MSVGGQAGVVINPISIEVILHGLAPNGGDVTPNDTWFRNPNGTPFFGSEDPNVNVSGLTYGMRPGHDNIGTALDRNDVHVMWIDIRGNPRQAFTGPFILRIPANAFAPSYESAEPLPPVAPPPVGLLPNTVPNTVYTFPRIGPTTPTQITSSTNAGAVFNISQSDFGGTVTLIVPERDSTGGSSAYRTITVESRNTDDDVWLMVRFRGTNRVDLVRVPAPGLSGTDQREHIITVSSPTTVEISVVRLTNRTDTIPNLVTGNFAPVELASGVSPVVVTITP